MQAERSIGQRGKPTILNTLNNTFAAGLSAQQSQPSRQSPQKGAKVEDEDEEESEDAGDIQPE